MTAKTRPCQRCGAEIPAARLEAIPDTRICKPCSEEIGGEYIYTVVKKNLGKAGSLKKTSQDWDIKKRRKHIEPKDQ
jgi:hypothetical protein